MKLTKSKLKEIIKEEIQNLNEFGIGFTPDDVDIESTYIAPERNEKEPMKAFFQKYSSKEAQKIVEGGIKDYVKLLRKAQQKIIGEWMRGAKAGAFDYFDLVRGFHYGDVRRGHIYELEFLRKMLLKDKIENRFRAYFKGKKGKPRHKKPFGD